MYQPSASAEECCTTPEMRMRMAVLIFLHDDGFKFQRDNQICPMIPHRHHTSHQGAANNAQFAGFDRLNDFTA